MDKHEKKVLEEYDTFCLTTGSEKRLKKTKIIISNSRKIIGKDLTKLNIEDIVKFLAYINQSDYKAWTKNDYKKIFKRFLKWYYKDLEMVEGMQVKDGFRGCSSKRCFNKEKVNKNTLIKKKELEKLIRTANSLKWKALISFAFESAFRPCETRVLKWKDLMFDDSKGICRVWILSPKTQESREIIVKDCVLHLKRWKAEYSFPDLKDSDYVFPSQHHRDKPMGDGVISEMFKRLSKKAELRNINPYLLRHSRIYEIQKRLPQKIASKFAGHSIETSELYNHLDSEDVEESMLKIIYPTTDIPEEKKIEMEKEIEKLKQDRKKWADSFVKVMNEINNIKKGMK